MVLRMRLTKLGMLVSRLLRKTGVASYGLMKNKWIIVAPRTGQEIVESLMERAALFRMGIVQVFWADCGPLKVYSSAKDLWRDQALS